MDLSALTSSRLERLRPMLDSFIVKRACGSLKGFALVWMVAQTGFILLMLLILLSPLVWAGKKPPLEPGLSISVPAFRDQTTIPAKYTCDGQNILPAMEIQRVPKNAHALAIIVDDVDAPTEKPWTHLALWNLPAEDFKITEGMLPSNAIIASNDFGQIGYTGPCPPRVAKITKHRYYFRVIALDSAIRLPRASKRMDLDKMMAGHIVAKAEWMGTYERPGATKPPKNQPEKPKP